MQQFLNDASAIAILMAIAAMFIKFLALYNERVSESQERKRQKEREKRRKENKERNEKLCSARPYIAAMQAAAGMVV